MIEWVQICMRGWKHLNYTFPLNVVYVQYKFDFPPLPPLLHNSQSCHQTEIPRHKLKLQSSNHISEVSSQYLLFYVYTVFCRLVTRWRPRAFCQVITIQIYVLIWRKNDKWQQINHKVWKKIINSTKINHNQLST